MQRRQQASEMSLPCCLVEHKNKKKNVFFCSRCAFFSKTLYLWLIWESLYPMYQAHSLLQQLGRDSSLGPLRNTHTHQSVSLSLSHFSCFYLIKAKEPGKCTQVWSRYHCKMTQAAAPLDLSKWNKSMSDLLCKCQTAMCKYVQNLTYAKTHTLDQSY